MTDSGVALAVDVGGTKLAAALVDADGSVSARAQVATSPTAAGRGDQLWDTLRGLVSQVCAGHDVVGVGVGCGGPLRWPSGHVSPLNLPAWRDFPLRDRLRGQFTDVPVRLVNDAVAVAIGEHWRGCGQDSRALLGVVVSTGVGGGLVVDGRMMLGETGNAGHVGHVLVDPGGPECGCGARGCLEAVARGPAAVRWAQEQGWRSGDGAADGRALVAAATYGDEIAGRALERAGSALGTALASAANLLELDTVAVGGGLANAGELLLGPAREAFARHARMDFAARCRILPAALGDDAGLVGAAALVLDGDRYWPAGAD